MSIHTIHFRRWLWIRHGKQAICVWVIDILLYFLYPATGEWWGIMVSRWSSVCLYICLSLFSFPDYNLNKCRDFLQILYVHWYCVDLVWGFPMDKFGQFLTELSAWNKPEFSHPDNNFSKCQWIFTELDICIDIMEIWFEIANGQIFIFVYFWQSCLPTTR